VEGVKAIQRHRTRTFGQAPGPSRARGDDHPGAGSPEDDSRGPLRKQAHLARRDVHDREDERRTEARRTHTERSIEAEALLCVVREPANPVDPVLLAAHPEVLTSIVRGKFRPMLAPVFEA
jgi:hypothetical protein